MECVELSRQGNGSRCLPKLVCELGAVLRDLDVFMTEGLRLTYRWNKDDAYKEIVGDLFENHEVLRCIAEELVLCLHGVSSLIDMYQRPDELSDKGFCDYAVFFRLAPEQSQLFRDLGKDHPAELLERMESACDEASEFAIDALFFLMQNVALDLRDTPYERTEALATALRHLSLEFEVSWRRLRKTISQFLPNEDRPGQIEKERKSKSAA